MVYTVVFYRYVDKTLFDLALDTSDVKFCRRTLRQVEFSVLFILTCLADQDLNTFDYILKFSQSRMMNLFLSDYERLLFFGGEAVGCSICQCHLWAGKWHLPQDANMHIGSFQ